MGGMAAGICLLLVMAFSSQAMEAASQAARVFAGGVMPALLPMMVLCRLLPAHANHERSAWRGYAGAVFFSFASGSPASAQRVRDLWGAGALARGALEPLLAACGVMGPMFFTGTLAQWTGLRAGCWVLLLCHWTGALAAAGVVRLAARKQPACRTGAAAAPAPGPAAPRPSLPEAVTGAATSLLAVCGAMMTFAIVAGVLRALVAALFPAWTASHGRLLAAGMGAAGDRRRRGGGAGGMAAGAHGAAVRAVLVRRSEHLAAKPAVCAGMHTPREAALHAHASRGAVGRPGPADLYAVSRPYAAFLKIQNLLTT